MYPILAYLLFAFGWWTVLLLDRTRETHESKVEQLGMRLVIERKIAHPNEIETTAAYTTLVAEFERQQRMVVGEAVILAITILGAIYFGYANVRQEVSATQQQRNFLLSITHELKSPIAGIRLILETFQKRKQLPAEIQEKLSTNALKETDRLTALVNDLLLSAKLETSYVLNLEPLRLQEILQETAEKVANKYPGAKIHLDIEPDLPPISGDRMAITSVVVNLLENAAKYSQPTPQIEVNIRRGSRLEILLTIADNGIGIPDNEKGQVWKKFYRVGSEDTRQTKGTGLGLYIVRQLVERHQGHIELQNNVPKGSRFIIALPIAN